MSTKTISKTAWQRRNDRGPHLATLPSGAVVRFQVADLSQLLRANVLPEPLRSTASLMAAHEEGPNGYMRDMVQTAILRGGDSQATIAGAVQVAADLTHYLVAETLVEPKVTPEEVASGLFPEADVKMLVEFATRERNVDAAGQRLPIMCPAEEKWATFRYERPGLPGAGVGEGNGAELVGAVPGDDGDAM